MIVSYLFVLQFTTQKNSVNMKTSNIIITSSMALVLFGALTFTSCKKENSSATDQAATEESIVNDNEAEAAYDDVFDNTMGIGAETGEDIGITGSVGIFGGRTETGYYAGRPDSVRCFTVTVNPVTIGVFPKTVTIDFGAGCLGKDGKVRKGKIITVFTGRMVVPGSKATTTFDGYKVDSLSITGSHEVVNNSTSSTPSFTTRVVAGKLTWDSGRWVKWSNTRTVTQLEGNGTPLWPLDDIFSITGAGQGENSKGRTWSHEVIEPLIKKFTCRWISKGIIRVTHNGKTGTLDYGNGDCDNQAVLTVNGNTKVITLR